MLPWPPKQTGFDFVTSSSTEVGIWVGAGITGTIVFVHQMTREKFRISYKALGVGVSKLPIPLAYSKSLESSFSTGSPLWFGPRGRDPFQLSSIANTSISIHSAAIGGPTEDGRAGGSSVALIRFGGAPLPLGGLLMGPLTFATTTSFLVMGGEQFMTPGASLMYYYGVVHSLVNVT